MKPVCALVASGLMIAAVTTGCAGDNAESDGPATTDLNPTPTTMVPQAGLIAQPVESGGVRVEVLEIAPTYHSPKDRAQIIAEVRSENLSGVSQRNPNVSLVCADRVAVGEWAEGSTWEPNGILSVNAVLSGNVIIGFPQAGPNAEYPSVTCEDATLRVQIVSLSAETVTIDFPVAADIIETALRSPNSAEMPLPYAEG
ncbi:MAG: hypothetical protein M9952_03955 [Microthrixaceae bacterium]|nr:hypothetical protein [Microthrixaceae bacterium]MCO5312076.1 hypothetical protein [Microthrixaceae bacterium]